MGQRLMSAHHGCLRSLRCSLGLDRGAKHGRIPNPKHDFIVTMGFALQRANAKMVRDANLRRRRNRAGERYASSADQSSDSE